MSPADWIHAGSLIVIACALVLSIVQIRYMARQLREATAQTRSIQVSLSHAAYRSFLDTQARNLGMLGTIDAELLRWHQQARGYHVPTGATAVRTQWIIMRFDTHEAAFLSYAAGLLPDDIWIPCLRSLHADLATPEYVEVWGRARKFYAVSFATMVDALLADAAHSADEPGDVPATGVPRGHLHAGSH